MKSKTVIKITVSKGEKIKMTPQTQNTPKPYETKTSAPAKTSVPKTQTKKNEKKIKMLILREVSHNNDRK